MHLQVFAGTENGSVGSLDITSHKYTTMLRSHSDAVNAVALSSTGEQLVTGSSDGTIRVWNAETYQQLCALATVCGSVCEILFCADARHQIRLGNGTQVQLIYMHVACLMYVLLLLVAVQVVHTLVQQSPSLVCAGTSLMCQARQCSL